MHFGQFDIERQDVCMAHAYLGSVAHKMIDPSY
jgi:hypothetical protein